MSWRPLVLFYMLLCSTWSVAQITSSLSGSTSDASTGTSLPGATVQVFVGDTSYSTVSDATGTFRLSHLPTGIHRVRASFIGYGPVENAEVWVRPGKEERVDMQLHRAVNELAEVVVRATAPQRMDAISAHTLTVEQSLRFPATFFDPARLAMSYSGVASTNDEGNHFSVRGNSPASNAWLLEGAEIVTPNHLTNAGTQSDLPTLTGGGTTILSAQMLGTSRLLMGGLAAPYGNALGGIMDLRLRSGTNERHAFTGQAGLIGIDLSAEGPLRNGGKASYLVNYRYSTLGLLSAMDVALGDEAITFQDLSFNVTMPIKDRSVLTLFGMGGNSSNRFDAKDSTEWEFDKDSQNIGYTAKVGVAGMTFKQRIGGRTAWHTAAVVSMNDQQRTLEQGLYVLDQFVSTTRDTATLREEKISIVSQMRTELSARATLQIGASGMQRTVVKQLTLLDEASTGWLLRPFARLEYDITERLHVDLGVAYAHWTANGSGVVEPRVALRMDLGDRDRLSLAVGQRSQLPAVQNYAGHVRWQAQDPFAPTDNSRIGLLRSKDVELTYDHAFRPHLRLSASAFFQYVDRVPVGVQVEQFTDGREFSLTNEWDAVYYLQLVAQGDALNAGGQIALTHTFHKGFFYQVNATAFDATYADRAVRVYDSRWNTGVIANAVVGKEFMKLKEDRKRTWGVNGRVNTTGGQRYTPMATPTAPEPVAYSAQYPSTYRVDIRIYLKREHKRRTGMWSVDLLNATNAKNVAYRYFDHRKGEEVAKYQLGLIPNLSYRIEF
ncbi:MAG TPA: carboxypeptidase-like regulatory domain-containing protein [Flavobacteriales bacterium]|jgi:hypothetical protein|nr:carboxypeptidase-like regulatory domain-containing protein [Flavobacteriales bacterium]MBK6551929.1 carboxypeptidase-like regulatory domain-containing protein [Flavobacteriales bacterium]MBK7620795.1 carboxypeptidase-like regulatory domain-containing protein [Flavobacteriales bacterium]MBK8708668.1 carboxypeptidase-like regulatory domain-containing protein [Flavobacteriales bacterium]MBP9176643.1 carboxypeptidase-like regulatory domain-containing protein [Flavobacteriales bacterium]